MVPAPELPVIGVLDWGVGGLFAVERILHRSPSVDLAFLSDSGTVPYGRQQRPQLRTSVRRAVHHLRGLGARRVLVACHSASTVLSELALPEVYGVICPAHIPRSKKILVLGGIRTIRSGAWRRALAGHGVVVQRIAQPLSAAVEAGRIDHPTTRQHLHRVLAPVQAADTVVLACTHYIALAPQIQALMPHAAIIDPALVEVGHWTIPTGSGRRIAQTTGDVHRTREVATRLIPSVARQLRFEAWSASSGPAARNVPPTPAKHSEDDHAPAGARAREAVAHALSPSGPGT